MSLYLRNKCAKRSKQIVQEKDPRLHPGNLLDMFYALLIWTPQRLDHL